MFRNTYKLLYFRMGLIDMLSGFQHNLYIEYKQYYHFGFQPNILYSHRKDLKLVKGLLRELESAMVKANNYQLRLFVPKLKLECLDKHKH